MGRKEKVSSRLIQVDREEYAALLAVQERYEVLEAGCHALSKQYQGALAANQEQVTRVTRLSLENEHLRTALRIAEDKLAKAKETP